MTTERASPPSYDTNHISKGLLDFGYATSLENVSQNELARISKILALQCATMGAACTPSTGAPRMTDYVLLAKQVRSLAEEDAGWIALLANTTALVMDALPDLNWVGFYLVRDATDGSSELVVGPFQGRLACARIPFGRGVCGRAAATGETIVVPDVHAFPGHIACDSVSAAEIVVPLHLDGHVVAVFDVDSPVLGRFSSADRDGLERLVSVLEDVAQRSVLG